MGKVTVANLVPGDRILIRDYDGTGKWAPVRPSDPKRVKDAASVAEFTHMFKHSRYGWNVCTDQGTLMPGLPGQTACVLVEASEAREDLGL